uniref:Uncharacterized protein n=1 Tax=Anguilla anguilla TaxID=7936 RepID=A0A0E9WZS0_ANGAN
MESALFYFSRLPKSILFPFEQRTKLFSTYLDFCYKLNTYTHTHTLKDLCLLDGRFISSFEYKMLYFLAKMAVKHLTCVIRIWVWRKQVHHP